MRILAIVRRLSAVLLFGLVVANLGWPGSACAGNDFPDFYGTLLSVDQDRGLIVIATDSDEVVTVDVKDLGATPFNEGAFKIDNVVLVRVQRVGDVYRAIGWEQTRDGNEDSARG